MNFHVVIATLCLAIAAPPAHPAGARKNTEPDLTALGALSLLPKGTAKRVARIEAREGNPWPARWYVLVHDPEQPRGLREFVFTGGKQIATRQLSQFADALSENDVVGADAIKVNSDTVAGVAGQFALHNGVRLASVNYELRKTGDPAVPVWHLTCLDPAGDQLGTIQIHAGKGGILGFDGFQKAPFAEANVVARPDTRSPAAPKPAVIGKPAGTGEAAIPKPIRKKDTGATTTAPAQVARTALPKAPPPDPVFERPGRRSETMDRIGDSLRKAFKRDE